MRHLATVVCRGHFGHKEMDAEGVPAMMRVDSLHGRDDHTGVCSLKPLTDISTATYSRTNILRCTYY